MESTKQAEVPPSGRVSRLSLAVDRAASWSWRPAILASGAALAILANVGNAAEHRTASQVSQLVYWIGLLAMFWTAHAVRARGGRMGIARDVLPALASPVQPGPSRSERPRP